MDFGQLISVAQQNTQQKNQGNYYKTKLEPPKKESKDKKLSANIQKFLEQKKREEQEMLREKIRKREELMAKRDTKEKNKIAKMLKVTKSANKSVLADAIDNNDTALTLEGPEQPDEDDYGYTSLESGNLYKKLMEKYSQLPPEEKFSKSSGKSKLSQEEIQRTKQRVREAIMKEREEESNPHKRRERKKHEETEKEDRKDRDRSGKERYQEEKEKPEEKVKKKKLLPAPIVDFNQLLKLAEQKQHEPVEIEVPVKKEEQRLMTKKERREMEERDAYWKAKEQRAKNRELGISEPPKEPPRGFVNGKIPKLNSAGSSNDKKPAQSTVSAKSDKTDKFQLKKPVNGTKVSSSQPTKSIKESSSSVRPSSSKAAPSSSASSSSSSKSKIPEKPREKEPQRKSLPSTSSKPSTSAGSSQKSREFPPKDLQKSKEPQKTREFPPKYPQKTREFPPKDLQKTRPFPPKDVPQKTREFPPKDLQRTREFPPKDLQRSREFPPRDLKRPPQGGNLKKKRVIEDEDSEYDSEMDDFIDDGDEEMDYSSEIKKIFGYDKSRFRDEDDFDDRNMEANFAQVMREEFISKKIGIMEDLEDMRQEAMEKKMKSKKRRRLD